MEEPLLSSEERALARPEAKPAPFAAQVMVLATAPTALAFCSLSVLAAWSFLETVLGLGCMLLSGLAAVIIVLGVILVQTRREALMDSRYVFMLYVLSAVSEAVLWVLAGLLLTPGFLVPVMAVALGTQLVLTLLHWREALPTSAASRIAAGVGIAQMCIILLGGPNALVWVLLCGGLMVASNVVKAGKVQRLVRKRPGDTKEAALSALLLQHYNGKKLLRALQALKRRVQKQE